MPRDTQMPMFVEKHQVHLIRTRNPGPPVVTQAGRPLRAALPKMDSAVARTER